MSGPRVEYRDATFQVEGGGEQVKASVPSPAAASASSSSSGDGSIFISIASYRDGERCGQTLKSIFENAKNPDKVFVGLVESNHYDDKFCLEEYCSTFGIKSLTRQRVRSDVYKIMTMPENRDKCPHYHQVKYLAFHKVGAKGPIYARSLTRKLLGNEEYCMQLDAHSALAKDWDVGLTEQWTQTQNEFGVISTVPAKMEEMEFQKPGGANEAAVPRMCQVQFRENGFPDYEKPADGVAHDLTTPLLSHGWSAAFSFAKCHLEEAVPYDPFSFYAMPIEQFGRYARMWTRGYDTYTPTKNYVFHDYGDQPNGHGNAEWFKNQKQRFRVMSIERVKLMLEIPFGGEQGDKDEVALNTARANLGLYGLGKRRSLAELQKFVNMNFLLASGNAGQAAECMHGANDYVSYDAANISPYENLYDKPDDLDPQPEFPLRDVFYENLEQEGDYAEIGGGGVGGAKSRLAKVLDLGVLGQNQVTDGVDNHHHLVHDGQANMVETSEFGSLPPFSVLFVLWVFGLVVWAVMYMNTSSVQSTKRAVQRKILKAGTSHKDV